MSELPCPNCGSDLTFLDQYQRYYCQRCQRYAPEGYGAMGAKKCPTCGGILSYVALYDRFYCYRCNAYAPLETPAPIALQPSPAPESGAAIAAPPETKPAEPALAAAPSPAEAVAAKATPASSPEASVGTAVTPAEPTPAAPTTAAAELTSAKTEETKPVAEEVLPTPPSVKPAVLRLKIFSMKKAELVDLCKAYRLHPDGTKEELQERLLNHLKDLEAKEESEAEPPEEKPAEPSVTAAIPSETRTETPVETAPEEATPSAAIVPTVDEVAHAEPPVHVDERLAESAGTVLVTVPATPAQEFGPKVEHPCPTCGRELSYIAQYGRWYCYSCQRYAPAIASKNACPTCGATMRWIDQYERWWCDNCRRYASADLPAPTKGVSAAASTAQAGMETAVVAKPAVAVAHRHGNPASGVGLIVFGVLLYLVYEAFVVFPLILQYAPPFSLTADQAALLNFFAFLLVAGGAVAGLSALKHRG